MPLEVDLKTLRKRFNERETSEMITEDIAQLAEFFLKMFFLSLMKRLKNKSQKEQLLPNLHLIFLHFYL